jgi:hypothetical protein
MLICLLQTFFVPASCRPGGRPKRISNAQASECQQAEVAFKTAIATGLIAVVTNLLLAIKCLTHPFASMNDLWRPVRVRVAVLK